MSFRGNSMFYWKQCVPDAWPGLVPVALCDLVVTQIHLISICPIPQRAVVCAFFPLALQASLSSTYIGPRLLRLVICETCQLGETEVMGKGTANEPLIILLTAWRVLMTITPQPKITTAPATYVFHDLDDSLM